MSPRPVWSVTCLVVVPGIVTCWSVGRSAITHGLEQQESLSVVLVFFGNRRYSSCLLILSASL